MLFDAREYRDREREDQSVIFETGVDPDIIHTYIGINHFQDLCPYLKSVWDDAFEKGIPRPYGARIRSF